jgi:hypothetical protein
MGDVVALRPGDGTSSNCRLPDWPHPRKITLTIEQARAIERDIRHLGAVMERARDIRAISMILSTFCGVEDKDADLGARVLQRWVSTGRIG